MYNRKIAVFVLVVAVVFSVFWGTVRSVRGLRDDVSESYFDDSSRYGSVRSDLDKVLSCAYEVLSIYTAVVADDEKAEAFESALTALEGFVDEPLKYGFSDAVVNVRRSASDVYYRIEITEEIYESQEYLSAVAYYREMQSSFMRIENNKNYSAAVKKYNGALSSFPGNIVADVFSMTKASLIGS